MRKLIIFITFFIFLSGPAITFGQDFNDGIIAIKNGNYEEAVRIFRIAAKKGDKYAQHCLGVLLQKGIGVEQNYEESFKWVELAAKQGLLQAEFDLGIFIYHKNHKKGAPKN